MEKEWKTWRIKKRELVGGHLGTKSESNTHLKQNAKATSDSIDIEFLKTLITIPTQ